MALVPGLMPSFPPFDPEGEAFTVAQRWKKWPERFQLITAAMNLTHPARKRAMLLYYVGETTHDTFKTLPDTGG